MGYNLFAKVTVLPKGYYFCAKGGSGGWMGKTHWNTFYDRSHVLGVKLHTKLDVFCLGGEGTYAEKLELLVLCYNDNCNDIGFDNFL